MRLLFLTMKDWRTYIRWAEWLIAVAAIVYLVWRLYTYQQWSDMGTCLQWRSFKVELLLLWAILLIPVQLLVEAARWRYVVRGWQDISLQESWRQMMAGLVAGFITPYRSGDIPARLLASGIDISREEAIQRAHQWLKDWHKWGAVLGYTALRYSVWGVQLWAMLASVGISMPLWQGIGSIALYYVMISIMPALPAADVALKGGWAVWIFGAYTSNVPAVMVAVTLIWIFNTIIPVLFGSMKKILYFCKQIRLSNSPIHRLTD